MNKNATSDIDGNTPDNLTISMIPSRGSIIRDIESARLDLFKRIKTGKIRDISLERARCDQLRLFVYMSQVEAGILKDIEMDEIRDRLDQVEAMQQEQQRARRVHHYSEPYYDCTTIAGGK